MEFVSTITKDGVRLKGLLYRTKSDKCCVFIPGFAGNPIDNDFIDILCSTLIKHGYSALCALNRGSFQLYTSTIPGKNEKPKKIGSCVENISDSSFDLDAWYSKILQLGFKDIILIGHCIGCNKIVNYLAHKEDLNNLKHVVLLSPLNMRAWLTNKNSFQHIMKAKEAEFDKQTGLIKCGFSYKTPDSIDDMLNNPIYMNLPNIYMLNSDSANYSDYKSIKKPITVIFGEEEHVSQTIQQNFITNAHYPDQTKCFIVPNANHCYEGQEQKLANTIVLSLCKKQQDLLYLLNKNIKKNIRHS